MFLQVYLQLLVKRAQSERERQMEEAKRQEAWDYQYSFGKTATEVERALEAQRRENHARTRQTLHPAPVRSNVCSIPSISTAPNPQERC